MNSLRCLSVRRFRFGPPPSLLRRVPSPYVPHRRFGATYLYIVQTAVEGFYHGQTLSLMVTPRDILTMVTGSSGTKSTRSLIAGN